MKALLIILMSFIMFQGFSQSFDNIKYFPNPFIKKISFVFKLHTDDSISLKIYDIKGVIRNTLLSNNYLKSGTYKIEHIANSLDKGVYIAVLSSLDKKSTIKILKNSNVDKLNLIDSTNFYYTDSIMINDSIKYMAYDTSKNLDNADKIISLKTLEQNINESLVIHESFNINNLNISNVEIYDISGKFLQNLIISRNSLSLMNLKNGIYLGLFYNNKKLIKTVKILKE